MANFYCSYCDSISFTSRSYLDHINSDLHAYLADLPQPAAAGASEEPSTSRSDEEPIKSEIDSLYNKFAEKCSELTLSYTNVADLSRNYAAFIVVIGAQSEVVAIGSGSGHVTDKFRTDGRQLYDCHAIVVARRSFIRYLYNELKACVAFQESIFQSCSADVSRQRLRPNVSIHIMMSQCPCGGVLSSMESQSSSSLIDGPLSHADCTLMGSVDHQPNHDRRPTAGKVFIKDIGLSAMCSVVDPWSSAPRVQLASCSDKLFRWNVLGLEGSLLGVFLDPIYAATVNLGQFDSTSDIRYTSVEKEDTNQALI